MSPRTGRPPLERRAAMLWLEDFLEDGPKTARAVFDAGARLGFAEKTLRRAAYALGVKIRAGGPGGRWQM